MLLRPRRTKSPRPWLSRLPPDRPLDRTWVASASPRRSLTVSSSWGRIKPSSSRVTSSTSTAVTARTEGVEDRPACRLCDVIPLLHHALGGTVGAWRYLYRAVDKSGANTAAPLFYRLRPSLVRILFL